MIFVIDLIVNSLKFGCFMDYSIYIYFQNELIGDRVIIPPASDMKTAEERPKQYECYDWWLCHKKL